MRCLSLSRLAAALLLATAWAAQLSQAATLNTTEVTEAMDTPGVVVVGSPTPVYDITLPKNATGLIITASGAADTKSLPGLYCRMLGNLPSNDEVPSNDNADYVGEQRALAPSVTISSADFGNETNVRCAVSNRGPSSEPLKFALGVEYLESTPQLVESEQAAAQAIFDSCCHNTKRCTAWRQNTAADVTNLCALSMNSCNEGGELVELNMRGYNLLCDFPLDAILNFTQLRVLNLRDNPNLKGSLSVISDSLATMEVLEEVNLEGDVRISGPLSTDGEDGVCALAQIAKVININAMSLTGGLPECMFFGSTTLLMQELIASNNKLSGALPDMNPGSGEPSLQVLRLANNDLSGDLPEGWLRQTELTWVDMSSNNISGTLVPDRGESSAAIAIPPNLIRLDLSNNALSGAFFGPSMLDETSLEAIDLSNNQLDQLPSGQDAREQGWLGAWDSLGTFVTRPPLQTILLGNNKLQGQFPTGFGDLPTLLDLDISNNKLSGTLPSLTNGTTLPEKEGTLFTSVHIFSASLNNFSGTIPDDWQQFGMFAANGTFSTDTLFSLANNSLTGALPQWLAYSSVKTLVPVPSVNLTGNSFESGDCADFGYTGASCEETAAPPAASPDPPQSPGLEESPAPDKSPEPAPAPSDTSSDSDDGSSGLSTGAAAGIAIAVILAIGAGVAGVFYWRKRRHLASGANPLSTNRFERFEEDPRGGGWHAPSPHNQPSGWAAYPPAQQQRSGVQMSTSGRYYDP